MDKKQTQIIKPGKYSDPTNYSDFLQRQNLIFTRDFSVKNISEQGIECTLPNSEGCYYVALIHPESVNSKASSFSEAISKRVPAVHYTPKNVHTTLANGYITRENFEIDTNILDRIEQIIKKLDARKISPLVYHEWKVNRGSIIAASYANESFFEIAHMINTEAKVAGLELNFPWGSHITVSRFSDKRKSSQMADLIDLIRQEKPLGQSTPARIAFGVAKTSRTQFHLEEYGSISI